MVAGRTEWHLRRLLLLPSPSHSPSASMSSSYTSLFRLCFSSLRSPAFHNYTLRMQITGSNLLETLPQRYSLAAFERRRPAGYRVVSMFSELPLSATEMLSIDVRIDPSLEASVFLLPNIRHEDSVRLLPGSNIFVKTDTSALDAQVRDAEFTKSSSKKSELPRDGNPEFAILGRSNAGKSSLVNALVEEELARTSNIPGKTQLINHYLVNKSWYLVELPGYGHEKAPLEVLTFWKNLTETYLMTQRTLVMVLLLVDARVPPQQIDLDRASWLVKNQIPMTFVFTKCDKKKISGRPPEENVEDFQKQLKLSYKETPPWIMTSSVTNQGRDELLLHIAQLRNYWKSGTAKHASVIGKA